MSNLAKLSKQAIQLEQDRHYAKALGAYVTLFDEARTAQEEVDVALYNRAGDVAMRAGDTAQGVTFYERAIDGYAAGGLLNNAIAVSNKLLRHDADHAPTHYTLAVLHAKQGFRGDARHHYVEYAERMHRAGRDDDALRALSEFSTLCSPGDDARAALARHLQKANRGTELATRFDAMLAASAAPAPSAPAAPRAADASLVFLDVTHRAPEPTADVLDDVTAPIAGLELTSFDLDAPSIVEDAFVIDDDVLPADEPIALDFLGVDPVSLDAPSFATNDLALLDWSTDDVVPTGVPAIASRYWERELPGELPALALVSWIGSATTVLGTVDEIAPDVVPAVAPDVVGPAVIEPEPAAPAPIAAETDTSTDDFIDLGDWLRSTEPAPDTRLVAEQETPTGDEQADFDRLLRTFRAGVARTVDDADHASHFDLGVAFREMGLIDEAIAQFQRAAHGEGQSLRTREALAQCFLDRGSPELAIDVVEGTVAARQHSGVDERTTLGVLYLLGDAHARLGRDDRARECYRRVVAVDIDFRDAARRLTLLSDSTP